MGLVKQCVERLRARSVLRLTQTFLTLSLEDIAKACALEGPREAEAQVLRMAERGEVCATIDQKAGMAREQRLERPTPTSPSALPSLFTPPSALLLTARFLVSQCSGCVIIHRCPSGRTQGGSTRWRPWSGWTGRSARSWSCPGG